MAGWTVTVDLSNVTVMLQRLAADIQSKIPQEALQAGADQLTDSARSSAPVLTGALRNSIATTNVSATNATVEASVDYAAFVEFGTSKMSAEPYMIPGIPTALTTLTATAVNLLRESIG